ncbi:ABC transporter substrate-binding protein [Pseudonocardia sp. MH-G8]|nr:ABC transporter substrate-binding protein [Pseudonocardia sp. MH-G8]
MTTPGRRSWRGRVRAVSTAIAAAAAVAVLAACGAGTEPTEPAAPAAGSAPGFPVTIEHAFGTTTIEQPPQRVVALGFNEADFVLALGAQPVGVRDFIGSFDEDTRAWARDLITGPPPEKVGGNEIDFEKIAQLQPDLIMGVYSFMDRSDYDKLSQLAPTVAAPSAETTTTWQEQTRITGQALGKPGEAEQLVASVEQRFADASAAHPSFAGKTIAVALAQETATTYVLEPTDLRAQFFTDLGFVNSTHTGAVSPEQFGVLDEDVLVVLGAEEDAMLANPVFAQVPVVSEGRTYFTGTFASEFNGALGFGSPLSLPYALEIAVPELSAVTEAVPGG